MIQRVNQQFVSTTIPWAELDKLAHAGDKLAREVADHWQYPVNLMFLSPEGRFISKLSSLKDLTDVHPDTQCRPTQTKDPASAEKNSEVFFKHIEKYLGSSPPTAKQ